VDRSERDSFRKRSGEGAALLTSRSPFGIASCSFSRELQDTGLKARRYKETQELPFARSGWRTEEAGSFAAPGIQLVVLFREVFLWRLWLVLA
jgi:hypothetical protein